MLPLFLLATAAANKILTPKAPKSSDLNIHRNAQIEHHHAMTDVYTGSGNHFWNSSMFQWRESGTNGYGLELNGRAGFQRGQDAVLAFDFDGNGRHSKAEVAMTNDMMKAAGGNYDFNKDGNVSLMERLRGFDLRARYRTIDRDQDGRLQSSEMHAAGGVAWKDLDGDGHIQSYERQNLWNSFSRRGGLLQAQGVDWVDGYRGTQQIATSTFAPRPYYPSYGCGHY